MKGKKLSKEEIKKQKEERIVANKLFIKRTKQSIKRIKKEETRLCVKCRQITARCTDAILPKNMLSSKPLWLNRYDPILLVYKCTNKECKYIHEEEVKICPKCYEVTGHSEGSNVSHGNLSTPASNSEVEIYYHCENKLCDHHWSEYI